MSSFFLSQIDSLFFVDRMLRNRKKIENFTHSGHVARLTASSVIASQGDSAVLATCVANPLDSESSQIPGGGVPLTVDYRYLCYSYAFFSWKKLKDIIFAAGFFFSFCKR